MRKRVHRSSPGKREISYNHLTRMRQLIIVLKDGTYFAHVAIRMSDTNRERLRVNVVPNRGSSAS